MQCLLHAMDRLGTRQQQGGKSKTFVLTYSAAVWSPMGLLRSVPDLIAVNLSGFKGDVSRPCWGTDSANILPQLALNMPLVQPNPPP